MQLDCSSRTRVETNLYIEWFEIDKVLFAVLQVHLFTLYLYFKYIFWGVLLRLLE